LNEVAVLFPLLVLFTVAYLGWLTAEFFWRPKVLAPWGLLQIYIALTAAYAAAKEIRRWAGVPEPPRKGALFVYLWFLLYLVVFLIRVFQPKFFLSEEWGKVILWVLAIFFLSRASKCIWEGRARDREGKGSSEN
jgi:hypothetical protein